MAPEDEVECRRRGEEEGDAMQVRTTERLGTGWSEVGLGCWQLGGADWGEVSDEDRARNEAALKQGSRLFSAYHAANSTKFWIITEADRSVTTVLLPADY